MHAVAPTFTQEPEDLTVVTGSNAVFECQTSGVPRPNISWVYYNPVSMTTTRIANNETNFTLTEMTDRSNQRLLMSTLTVLAAAIGNFGTYSCVATNVVALTNTSAVLMIHGKLPPGICPGKLVLLLHDELEYVIIVETFHNVGIHIFCCCVFHENDMYLTNNYTKIAPVKFHTLYTITYNSQIDTQYIYTLFGYIQM